MSLHARILAATLLAVAAATAAVQEEVPFITTPDNVTLAMLQLARVGPGDHVIDLGSGDGRIVITAARHFGATGLGVEIVGDLVRKSLDNARAAGVAAKVEFKEQDLFKTELRSASVVTMYLLPEVNLQLRPRLLDLAAGTRIVSHDWDMGDWQPDRTQTLEVPEKRIGRDKSSRVHLWVVPAKVQGLWCSPAGSLEVSQRFQHFSATLTVAGETTPRAVFDGRIEGVRLQSQGAQAALTVTAGGLRADSVSGPAAAFTGNTFQRAAGRQCG